MTEHSEHTGFEKSFREVFGDFHQSPDPAVWSRIDNALQRRKKLVIFYRVSIAASLFILISTGGWWIFRNYWHQPAQEFIASHESGQVPVYSKSQTVADDRIYNQLSDKTGKLAQTDTSVSSAFKPLKSPENSVSKLTETSKTAEIVIQHYQDESVAQSIAGKIPSPEEVLSEPSMPLTDAKLAEHTEIVINQESDMIGNLVMDPLEMEYLNPAPEDSPTKSQSGKWQLALGYGTLQGHDASEPSDAFNSANADFSHDRFSSKLVTETSKFSDIENTTHSRPFTFGVTVHRSFSGIWGIETGLLLTRLKTNSKTGLINNEFTEYGSELYYIGLPLSVRLNMIHSRRFGMYLSQGAILEKGIRTRYYMHHYAFDMLKNSENESYMADGVQISSLTALGFEYHLTGLLSIYAQPGLQIFFLNKTQPFNIRSSNAIWPSLQTGIKVGL